MDLDSHKIYKKANWLLNGERNPNSCNEPRRVPGRCFLAVQSDWNDQKHASCRDIFKVKVRWKVCYKQNQVKKRLCEKEKEEIKVFLYVNIPLLGQKSQVGFLGLGDKTIFRQAEERRGFVNRSILGEGLKGHLWMNLHSLGHDG